MITENEKNLALSLAKIKIDKLIDFYYTKRNPQLEHFDKEGLLGKIAFDLLELIGILDGCKYNPFDEQAKVMNEADKRKDILQNEKELNPDVFTKDVSADNLEKINQRAEYNANDYIGHSFDDDEDTSVTYARESYEIGFKQGWQEGETYGFDKGFDFCEQINADNQTMWMQEPNTGKFIPISYPADAPLGQDMKGNFIYPMEQNKKYNSNNNLKVYLTKDISGLIQLWNNKPELCNDIWCSWIDKTINKNEIGIDVTCNKYFNSLFGNTPAPICISILKTITSKN